MHTYFNLVYVWIYNVCVMCMQCAYCILDSKLRNDDFLDFTMMCVYFFLFCVYRYVDDNSSRNNSSIINFSTFSGGYSHERNTIFKNIKLLSCDVLFLHQGLKNLNLTNIWDNFASFVYLYKFFYKSIFFIQNLYTRKLS